MLFDTHCHLFKEEYDDLDTIIKNMDGFMITNGCDDKTNKEVLEVIKKYNNVYGAIGFHPEEINTYTSSSLNLIEENLSNSKIVAIGEIGLDYYWVKDNKESQKKLFEAQLTLAEKYNMPVIIHSRDAIQDTLDIVKKYKVKGVIHSFSGSLQMANEFIKLGYKIGVGGVLTFKNSTRIQEVIKQINIDDIVLETDSPYLTPEPYRGKRNEPSNVYYVALKLSELKNVDLDYVLSKTTSNAHSLFDLKK